MPCTNATPPSLQLWAPIGARAGYFDQSHLIRDFRELVGCAPSQFRAPGDSLTNALLERPVDDQALSEMRQLDIDRRRAL